MQLRRDLASRCYAQSWVGFSRSKGIDHAQTVTPAPAGICNCAEARSRERSAAVWLALHSILASDWDTGVQQRADAFQGWGRNGCGMGMTTAGHRRTDIQQAHAADHFMTASVCSLHESTSPKSSWKWLYQPLHVSNIEVRQNQGSEVSANLFHYANCKSLSTKRWRLGLNLSHGRKEAFLKLQVRAHARAWHVKSQSTDLLISSTCHEHPCKCATCVLTRVL